MSYDQFKGGEKSPGDLSQFSPAAWRWDDGALEARPSWMQYDRATQHETHLRVPGCCTFGGLYATGGAVRPPTVDSLLVPVADTIFARYQSAGKEHTAGYARDENRRRLAVVASVARVSREAITDSCGAKAP